MMFWVGMCAGVVVGFIAFVAMELTLFNRIDKARDEADQRDEMRYQTQVKKTDTLISINRANMACFARIADHLTGGAAERNDTSDKDGG